MNYSETLDFLYSQLPMYQRIGGAAYKADLKNTISLCNLLGNPQDRFKSVHIAGTNGKGSTSNIIASVLQEAGLKTALYTSPHYKDFRERIRINGSMIPKEYVINFINKWKNNFMEIGLSFFEMTAGLAFQYYFDEKVDVAVIEVGMGGRLDSTNIIKPLLSVITNIGLDHTKFLGNNLEKIAIEKAGIIKKNVPVIIGETQENIKHIFINTALKAEAPIVFADQNYKVRVKITTFDFNDKNEIDIYKNKKIFLSKINNPLSGFYQTKNIATALQVLETLNNSGISISLENIHRGIENTVKNTGFLGRWQILGKNPLIVCDSGHNVDGIKQVILNLKNIPYKNLHFVLGFVNDKKIDEILSLLPNNAFYYFCKANIPRGLDENILFEMAKESGLNGESFSSVNKAYSVALKNAGRDDLVFIGGSTFIVAEVL